MDVLMIRRAWTIMNPPITTSLAMKSKTIAVVVVVMVMAWVTVFRSSSLMQPWGNLGVVYGIGCEYRWQHNRDDALCRQCRGRGRADVQLWRKEKRIMRNIQGGTNANVNLLQEIMYRPRPCKSTWWKSRYIVRERPVQSTNYSMTRCTDLPSQYMTILHGKHTVAFRCLMW